MHYVKSLLLAATVVFCATLANAGEPAGKVLARLEYTSSGCFHMTSGVLQIIQTADGIIASISSKTAGFSSDEITQNVKLTAAQLRAFNKFATELRALKEEVGCTSVNNYVLITDEITIRKEDGGCVWRGFYNMMATLFPVKEQ